jgi:glycine/D-amino acid oxidase-like deaminating enzyme
MVRAAEDHGAELRIATVESLATAGDRIAGVVAGGETIACDVVVIAMGPWSILASAWLPLPGVYGLKGHSLVFETGDRVPADALFLDYREASGGSATPEVFPRSDGTTYVCGVSSESALPVDPAAVAADPGALERLEAMCAAISPELSRDRIIRRQACFRPVTGDGLPLLGAVPGVAGAFVATGHSVWGILNAPATGEAMAELILDGEAHHVDIARLAPGRLAAFDAQRLRYE